MVLRSILCACLVAGGLGLTSLAQAQSLTTTYVGGIDTFDGNMFNVVAKEQVIITGFDVNLDAGAHTVEIYHRVPTYVGEEANSAAWTLLGSANVTSAGSGQATTVPLTLNLTMLTNEQHAFYITTQGTGIHYTSASPQVTGDVYAEDSSLRLLVGAGLTHPFALLVSDRVWNGTIRYTRNSTPPTISAINNQATNEDNSLGVPFSVADVDTAVTSLVTSATSSNQALVPNANLSITGTGTNRTLNVVPAPNQSGSATITVTVSDGGQQRTSSFVLTVNAVNDAPSFTVGPDVTVLEDSGAVSRAGWATNISKGPSDESTQGVSFLVTNNNNGLFSTQPAISSAGTLTFTPTANAAGTATVTVRLRDTGGTLLGGVDTSAAVTFKINVTAVNDAPVVDSKTVNTPEDTAVQVTFTGSDVEGQALTYSIVSQPSSGTLSGTGATRTYTPAPNFNGADSFTYRASDGSAQSAPATVTISISPVNDAPTFISPTPAEGAMLSASEGNRFTARVVAADVDMDVLSLSSLAAPAGASFNAATGEVSWTPAYADVGAHTFRFMVSDGVAQSIRQFVVNVTAQDLDNDGLPDAWERANGLDPMNADSDGDKISDGEEVGDIASPRDTDMDQRIDALDDDSDGDGILDADEAGDALLSTPAVDTDNDNIPDYRDTDSDADNTLDRLDNCLLIANADQADLDNDGRGDVCDDDMDGDTLPNTLEVSLSLDPMNADSDGDKISDGEEIGPDVMAPRDTDMDQRIDALDDDSDGDGILDADEAGDALLSTPAVDTDNDNIPDYRDTDSDADGALDGVDNCRLVANPAQADTNNNGVGDVCDGDLDGDGVANDVDNCPMLSNADQADLDGDMLGDACDADADGDEVSDDADNCLGLSNADQADLDQDGAGDACDDDDDADGRLDAQDNCPMVANADQADLDGDMVGDACDDDLDGDGVANAQDQCPDRVGVTESGCPVEAQPDMGQPTADMGADSGADMEVALVDSGVAGCGCTSTSPQLPVEASLWLIGLGFLRGVVRRRRSSRR